MVDRAKTSNRTSGLRKLDGDSAADRQADSRANVSGNNGTPQVQAEVRAARKQLRPHAASKADQGRTAGQRTDTDR